MKVMIKDKNNKINLVKKNSSNNY